MHMPGPVDPSDRGTIDLASMRRAQQYWMARGLVKTAQPLGDVVYDGPLLAARRLVPH
jgi:hypothetical protein